MLQVHMWVFHSAETSLEGLEDHLTHSGVQLMVQFYTHACTAGRL